MPINLFGTEQTLFLGVNTFHKLSLILYIATEGLHFHFSLSWIGEGNGKSLQSSCPENPRDRGAWWAAVYGVAQSQTRPKWLRSSSSGTLIMWEFNWKFYLGITNTLKKKKKTTHIDVVLDNIFSILVWNQYCKEILKLDGYTSSLNLGVPYILEVYVNVVAYCLVSC